MSFPAPRRVTVATTATRLDSTTVPFSGGAFAVQNLGSATVYVGLSTVTTATGWPVPAGSTLSLESASIDPSVGLYGIVAASTVEVAVLQVAP